MALPPDLLWASTSSIWRTAISALTESQGQQPLTPAVVEEVNQALYVTSLWTAYAKAFLPADKSITAGRITGNGDPGGSGRGLVITTDGTGTGILIAPPSGDALALTTTGAADITLESTRNLDATSSSATGTMTFGVLVGLDRTGIRIDHATRKVLIDGGVGVNGAGLRYPYQASDGLEVTIAMWPGLGGWMMYPNGNDVSGTTWLITTDAFVVGNLTAGTLDIDFRAPVPGITGNAEAVGTVYQLTAVASVWLGSGVVDPDIEIVERSRTTYVESVIATVNTATPTFSGAVALTPATHDYYARMTAAIPTTGSARTNGLLLLTLTINKFAVE